MPFQTIFGNDGILKTKHIPITGKILDFIPQHIPDNAIDIDSLIHDKQDLFIASSKVKNPTPIEDEDKMGEDEKEPNLLPPNEEEEGLDEIGVFTEGDEEIPEPEVKKEEPTPTKTEAKVEEKKEVENQPEKKLSRYDCLPKKEKLNFIGQLFDKCYKKKRFHDYDYWFEIACILKHEFKEECHDLFVYMSKKCPEIYNKKKQDNERRWKSIKESKKPATFGNMIFYAKQDNLK
jgi:hypothetical protein